MVATYQSDIEQIVQSICTTMLNLEMVRIETPSPTDERSLVAAVQIAGAWMGSVVLELSPEFARAATAAMLQLPEADVGPSDVQDVAAELANMVGGNLKSLLPAPSFLSLPTIVSGRELGWEVHDALLVDDVSLAAEHGTLRVRLFARPEEANEQP